MLWPDALWPQDIGAVAVLHGGSLLDADGRVRIDAVRRAVETRLHLVPRFRQLLQVPRRGLGPPLWVDAPAFDVRDHVRVAPVPVPGDEGALLRAVEHLRRQRLDRSRPLWEMWFLSGLAERRVALFVRMHHAIGDGIAGVATIGAFLDPSPDIPPASAVSWTPAPAPTTAELLVDNMRRHSVTLRHASSTLTRPVSTARDLATVWRGMRSPFGEVPTPTTSLDHVVGPGRALALIRSDMDAVRTTAHAHDVKINDVLLAATAGGLRALLRSRAEPVDDLVLPVYVPVTLRPAEQRAQARGNLIGQMVVPLPVGISDPGRRLRQIAAETSRQKAKSHPSLGAVLRSGPARRALLKVLDRHPVSVTTADVAGPPHPCTSRARR